MRLPRSAGLLLHPTSLPGPNGIGDLGPDAHRFLDLLVEMGITLWQVLPLGPTGYGNSPYQCFSSFAGNPLLIHVPDGAGDFPAGARGLGFTFRTQESAVFGDDWEPVGRNVILFPNHSATFDAPRSAWYRVDVLMVDDVAPGEQFELAVAVAPPPT